MPTNPFSNNNGKKKKNPFGFSIFWMYAIILIVLGGFFYLEDNSISKEVSFSDFENYIVRDHGIKEITVFTDKGMAEGVLTDSLAAKLFPQYAPGEGMHAKVETVVPSADKLSDKIDGWKAMGYFPADGNVKFERSGSMMSMLFAFGPVILLVALWFYMMRKMSGGGAGGGGGVFSVGKSKPQVFDKDSANKVTFKDVAGLSEAKVEIEEIVEFLKNPKRYTDLGGKIPKGALLVGPPGTGKTLLAKAVAGEADVPFFSMSGSDFVEMFVGVGASRVRDLFRQAKEKAPCIVFIDEIDTIGKKRDGAGMTGNDEREQTLNQLLSEMDGFDGRKGVVILAATNRPESLDPALLRPGRFDRRIPVELPDLPGREAILKVHARAVHMNEGIDYGAIARATSGASGAELANIVNEGALAAVRAGRPAVTQRVSSSRIFRSGNWSVPL